MSATLPPGFLPIADYPRCKCDWGDPAVLLFSIPSEIIKGKQRLRMNVGWLEAGVWMYAEPDLPHACAEYAYEPIAFMPIPVADKSTVEACTA